MVLNTQHFAVIHDLASSCRESGHKACHDNKTCTELASLASTTLEDNKKALLFDHATESKADANSEPTSTWSIPALIRTVEENSLSFPRGHNAFQRSVWATSALARLGEKGLPPDALIRTLMASPIQRTIALHTAMAYERYQTDKSFAIPYFIINWVSKLLIIHPELESNNEYGLEEIIAFASTGKFRDFVLHWIENAPISHIIDWRLSDEYYSDIFDEDLVVQGGISATKWIFDRFTKNYLNEWSPESLAWELIFKLDPVGTSERAGFDIKLLHSRVTSIPLILNALRTNHSTGLGNHNLDFGGLSLSQVQQEILHFGLQSDIKSAQYLAGEASRAKSGSSGHAFLHAFTLIPTHPEEALQKLLLLPTHSREAEVVMLADQITCYILCGRIEEAKINIQECLAMIVPGDAGWLWEIRLPQEQEPGPSLNYESLADWLEMIQEFIEINFPNQIAESH